MGAHHDGGSRASRQQPRTSCTRQLETMPRERLARAAAVAAARDGAQCVRPTCRASRAARCRGRRARTTSARWPTSRGCRSRVKTDLRDHYPFGLFARPHGSSRGCTRRRARRASRRSSATRTSDIDTWADLMARSLSRAGARPRRRRAQRLRLRPVHRRPRRALRRRAARCGGGAGVGRLDRAAGRADHGLRRARALRDAVVRAGDRRGRRAAGRRPARRARSRSACSAPSRGARRCAAKSRRASA